MNHIESRIPMMIHVRNMESIDAKKPQSQIRTFRTFRSRRLSQALVAAQPPASNGILGWRADLTLW